MILRGGHQTMSATIDISMVYQWTRAFFSMSVDRCACTCIENSFQAGCPPAGGLVESSRIVRISIDSAPLWCHTEVPLLLLLPCVQFFHMGLTIVFGTILGGLLGLTVRIWTRLKWQWLTCRPVRAYGNDAKSGCVRLS